MSRRAAAALTCLIAGLTAATAGEGEFSKERALSHARYLSDIPGGRSNGTKGEREARDYIASELARSGMQVRREPVARVGDLLVASENVLGVLEGRADRVIVISAHHDTGHPYTPGAGDDASGVAVMLEAARLLSARPPLSTLIFISFCAEHLGSAGSRSHLAGKDLDNVIVAVNVQDVGHAPVSLVSSGGGPPLWAARALSWILRRGEAEGVYLDPLVLIGPPGPGNAGSHVPFEVRGVPAVTITGSPVSGVAGTRFDTVSRLDPEALERAGRLLISLARRLDELPPRAADSSRYVPLAIGGRLYLVTAPAVIVLALLLAVLGAIWWRVFWWKARRRGRRLTPVDASRAILRAGIPVLGSAVLGLAGARAVDLLHTIGPAGSFEGSISFLLMGAFSLAGLGAGWILARLIAPASEEEIHTVLPYLMWGGAGLVTLVGGRPDRAFYFLLPGTLVMAVSLLGSRWAALGGLAGLAPVAAMVRSPTLQSLVDPVRGGGPTWKTTILLALLTVPVAVAMGRTFGMPGRRVSLVVLGVAMLAVLALGGAGLAGDDDPGAFRGRIEVEEKIPSAGPARVTVAGTGGLIDAVGTRLPAGGLGVSDGVLEFTLPERAPGPLLDVIIQIQPVESVHLNDVSGVKDVRVILMPGFPAEGVGVTLRADAMIEVLDGGTWSRGDRFSRILGSPVGPQGPAVITFRLAGRPGQQIFVESRAWASRDLLGLAVREERTLVEWRAEVFRADSAGL